MRVTHLAGYSSRGSSTDHLTGDVELVEEASLAVIVGEEGQTSLLEFVRFLISWKNTQQSNYRHQCASENDTLSLNS